MCSSIIITHAWFMKWDSCAKSRHCPETSNKRKDTHTPLDPKNGKWIFYWVPCYKLSHSGCAYCGSRCIFCWACDLMFNRFSWNEEPILNYYMGNKIWRGLTYLFTVVYLLPLLQSFHEWCSFYTEKKIDQIKVWFFSSDSSIFVTWIRVIIVD